MPSSILSLATIFSATLCSSGPNSAAVAKPWLSSLYSGVLLRPKLFVLFFTTNIFISVGISPYRRNNPWAAVKNKTFQNSKTYFEKFYLVYFKKLQDQSFQVFSFGTTWIDINPINTCFFFMASSHCYSKFFLCTQFQPIMNVQIKLPLKKTKKSMKQLLRKQFLQALARASSRQLEIAIHLLIHYLNCHWVFILVTFNHASIFQPLDILVNKSAKCVIAKKYQEWCVNLVLKQSNRCVQPHDPKVKTLAF